MIIYKAFLHLRNISTKGNDYHVILLLRLGIPSLNGSAFRLHCVPSEVGSISGLHSSVYCFVNDRLRSRMSSDRAAVRILQLSAPKWV